MVRDIQGPEWKDVVRAVSTYCRRQREVVLAEIHEMYKTAVNSDNFEAMKALRAVSNMIEEMGDS